MHGIYSAAPEAFTPPIHLKQTVINKTIKENFHKIVPYSSGFGEKETIYCTNNYRFDAIDPERLLMDGLSVTVINGAPIIDFTHFQGVEYEVYINGTRCVQTEMGYSAEKQRFPIGKLEVYCKKESRVLWKTTRLVRLY